MNVDMKQLREEVTQEVLASLITSYAEKAEDEKQATTHTAITLHDGSGIFSVCGLNREVISAHIGPYGLAEKLPLVPSVDTDPRYATLTGFTAASGAQPTNTCDAAPSAHMKGCTLTNTFGRVRFDTETIDWDRTMTRYNRGDFTDLVLLNAVTDRRSVGAGLLPTGLNESQLLNVIVQAEMTTAGVLAERELNRQIWQGNPLVNNEFPGLDRQIVTGIVDSDTNVACPALDSDVKDFAYNDVCGTTMDIVEQVSMMAYYLLRYARQAKVTPVKWAIVMRPELWYELSACWPCRYLSNRCQSSAGTELAVINDENNTRLRDEMRAGSFLWVNGIKYPVIEDDSIFESDSTNNANLVAGQFASSLYFVPLTIINNFPVTYREYLNYRHPLADQNVTPLRNRHDFWTDNGIFSWAYQGTLWCFLLGLKTQQRVMLLTPQLAGKIQNIAYTPVQHLRSSDPNSPYHFDGGLSARPIGTKYAAGWAPTGIGRDR
jgi:hypothetical protein